MLAILCKNLDFKPQSINQSQSTIMVHQSILRAAVGGQRSAGSGRRAAVGGQRFVGRQETFLIGCKTSTSAGVDLGWWGPRGKQRGGGPFVVVCKKISVKSDVFKTRQI